MARVKLSKSCEEEVVSSWLSHARQQSNTRYANSVAETLMGVNFPRNLVPSKVRP
jgi:hypothetical protein